MQLSVLPHHSHIRWQSRWGGCHGPQPLEEALEGAGSLAHGSHLQALPRAPRSSSQSSLECPEQNSKEAEYPAFINMMEYSVAKLKQDI